HIFPPWIKEDRSKYMNDDPFLAAMYSSPKAKMVTADELVEAMDREGVDISVALNFPWSTHKLCVETNDYIMESMSRYPKRLVGFCSVQPLSREAALDEIERCARGGLRGVGEFRPDMQSVDLKDESVIKPFIETVIRHKLILLTHTSEPVGHPYPGKGRVTPDVLYPLIASFPSLTLVCAHWGGGLPFYALMPEVKKAMSNVYFDMAASSYLYSPQIHSQVVQLVGADKILFGSDYPLLPPGRLIREIKSLNLAPEAEQLILGGNAQRLLGIKVD
ncbi:MAG: amidohydrolase, partial [Chloroflexi bacterium]|nr:amidohydrolase [Chloroflexota bacterium]